MPSYHKNLPHNITRDGLPMTIINVEWYRDGEVKNHFTVLNRTFALQLHLQDFPVKYTVIFKNHSFKP